MFCRPVATDAGCACNGTGAVPQRHSKLLHIMLETICDTLDYQGDAGSLLEVARIAIDDHRAVLLSQIRSSLRDALERGAGRPALRT